MRSGKGKTYLRVALGIAAVLIAVAAVSAYVLLRQFSGLCDVDDWDRVAFQSEAWKASAADDRFRYVREILDQELFVGAVAPQLYEALGKPDYVSTDEGGYATYVVRSFTQGGCGFNAIAILQFDFSQDRKVTGQKVRFD